MVDSVNLAFFKPLMNKRVERNRRRSVRSKRFFEDNPPPGRSVRLLCHAGAPELLDDGLIRLRSHCQIEHSPGRSAAFQLRQKRIQPGKRLGQVDVAGEILDQLRKQLPFRLVKPGFRKLRCRTLQLVPPRLGRHF